MELTIENHLPLGRMAFVSLPHVRTASYAQTADPTMFVRKLSAIPLDTVLLSKTNNVVVNRLPAVSCGNATAPEGIHVQLRTAAVNYIGRFICLLPSERLPST